MSNEQLDERVVEVHWDSAAEHWRMMRFRDDKPHGNHKNIVDAIIGSIADGVEKDAVSAAVLVCECVLTAGSSSRGRTSSATRGRPPATSASRASR